MMLFRSWNAADAYIWLNSFVFFLFLFVWIDFSRHKNIFFFLIITIIIIIILSKLLNCQYGSSEIWGS